MSCGRTPARMSAPGTFVCSSQNNWEKNKLQAKKLQLEPAWIPPTRQPTVTPHTNQPNGLAVHCRVVCSSTPKKKQSHQPGGSEPQRAGISLNRPAVQCSARSRTAKNHPCQGSCSSNPPQSGVHHECPPVGGGCYHTQVDIAPLCGVRWHQIRLGF
jgi:hypothetical protein